MNQWIRELNMFHRVARCIKTIQMRGKKMKKKASFLYVGIVLLLSLLLVACNTGELPSGDAGESDEVNVDGGNLIIGSTAAPTLFNPFYSTDTSSMAIEGFIFSTLIVVDREFNPEGDLAKDWDVSDDGMTYTFYLHEDVKWHDGEDLTADDVVFTYNIPIHEDYDGPRAYTYKDIEEITKIDDYTVEFQLSQPAAPFLPIAMQAGILPEHILGDVPITELGEHEFNTRTPIGSGPFAFDKWADGEYIRLEAFDDYHHGRPKIDVLTYKIVPDSNALMAQIQAGDISYSSVSSDHVDLARDLHDDGVIKWDSGESNAWEYIIWNLRDPLFQDLKVRQALTHALDREAIVEAVVHGQGTVAHAPGSPANWAFNPDTIKYEYNPEKAKELFVEAGWTEGSDGIFEKDGEKFSFTLKTSQGEAREKIAEVAQQQYKEIGVEVDIEVMEWSAFIEDTGPPNWNFDGQVSGMSIGSDPDPSYFWHTSEIEAGLNYSAYSNEKVDELLDQQVVEIDQDKRYELIKEIDATVAEELPVTFIYYPYGHIAYDPDLHGPEFSPANSYYKLHEWYFE